MDRAQVHSVGPGAVVDILDRVRTLPQLNAAADEATFQPPEMPYGLVPSYSVTSDEVQRMVKSTIYWQPPMQNVDGTVSSAEDPTWGFTVIVTAQSERLSHALDNWIAILARELRYHSFTLPVWAAEALQRLRLEVVQDPELEGASENEIRARFRRLLRSRHLLDQDGFPPPPARNMVCLVLDADTIARLAGLTVPENARSMEIHNRWERIKVQALDVYWSADEEDDEEDDDDEEGPYRGTGRLSVNALAMLYGRITSAASGSAMREMHPLDGFPG